MIDSTASQQSPIPPNGIMGLMRSEDYFSDWIWFGLAFFLLLILAVFMLRKLYQGKKPNPNSSEVLPENVSFLDRLRELTIPIKPTSQEEFFFQLTFIIREALELRHGKSLTDMTLKEMKSQISGREIPGVEPEVFWSLFELGDQVKFQKKYVPFEELERCHQLACDWLEKLEKAPGSESFSYQDQQQVQSL